MLENMIIAYVVLIISSFLYIVIPFSGSSVITPFLAILTSPHLAIALASFYFFLTGITRAYLFRKDIRWIYVRNLIFVSVIASSIGALALVEIDPKILLITILLFIGYFLYKKIKQTIKPKKESHKLSFGIHLIGLLSGFLQGTGFSGSDLRNGYLYSKGLNLAEVHGTTAIVGSTNFLIATIIRLLTKQVTIPDLTSLLYIFPFIIIGGVLGRHVIYKINKKYSDWIIILVMIIIIVFLMMKIVNI